MEKLDKDFLITCQYGQNKKIVTDEKEIIKLLKKYFESFFKRLDKKPNGRENKHNVSLI